MATYTGVGGGVSGGVVDAFNLDNLLAGLAWLREVNSDQIRRLWFPAYTPQGVRKVLRRLEDMELIERRMWSLPRPHIGTPVPTWRLGASFAGQRRTSQPRRRACRGVPTHGNLLPAPRWIVARPRRVARGVRALPTNGAPCATRSNHDSLWDGTTAQSTQKYRDVGIRRRAVELFCSWLS